MSPNAAASGVVTVGNLGSGSDYTPFIQHLGVPSTDIGSSGPYGVYHSIYDNHEWVRRFGDPGFQYHAAMASLWGVAALRLANADVLPFDYAAYGRDLAVYIDEVEAMAKLRQMPVDFGRLREQARRLAALALPSAAGTAEERRRRRLREHASRRCGSGCAWVCWRSSDARPSGKHGAGRKRRS